MNHFDVADPHPISPYTDKEQKSVFGSSIMMHPVNYKFFDRDLSLLEFNRRVLLQAADTQVPLLERVKFIAIFSNNMDEFFMKRMGAIKRAIKQNKLTFGITEKDPRILLQECREKVDEMFRLRNEIYQNQIVPELKANGLHLHQWSELHSGDLEFLRDYFRNKIMSVLTPLAVDPSHPFPFLSNMSVSLGVRLLPPKTKSGEELFARIKIPEVLPQWIRLPAPNDSQQHRYVRLIDVIQNNLNELFPEMTVKGVYPFMIVRNIDVEMIADDSDDMLDIVEEELRLRRLAEIVAIKYSSQGDPIIASLLTEELELRDRDFYLSEGEINYKTLFEIAKLNLPQMRYAVWTPVTHPLLADEKSNIFKILNETDILVHHPFDSFTSSVERFIRAAVHDPNVLAIKITFYRAGDDNQLIPLLIEAAEAGKEVVCVVELKARMDEAQNIRWAEVLEKSGVHVVFGMVGLKTHAKTALVVRQEGSDFRFYAHVGTGNYNAQTAKLYTDYGLFTSNHAVCRELIEVFNYLTGLSLKKNYKSFLVAPINMRERFMELIDKEISNQKEGKPSGIIAQMNSLEDKTVCEKLYAASREGVPIQLVVRGFCCLIPGVPGQSDNIEIKSIIGRFLEHSRVYFFRNGTKDPSMGKYLLASADWMNRNLSHRVELAIHIENKAIKRKLWDDLQAMLSDKVQSWVLQNDGSYRNMREHSSKAASDSESRGLHQYFMDMTRVKY